MVITTDAFFISERVKEIDKGYFLLYNEAKKRFEVHHKDGRPDTFCLALPYDELDARTLDYVHKTRIANIDKLIAEIDKQNENLEKARVKRILDQMKEVL